MAMELPDTQSESNEVIEALRLRAVRACELGYPLADIADSLGVWPWFRGRYTWWWTT
jgi:hypothetical protein